MAAYRASPQAASLTAKAEGPDGMLTTVRLYISKVNHRLNLISMHPINNKVSLQRNK
jgi:hypothetical protein